jgi:hypothetical protein
LTARGARRIVPNECERDTRASILRRDVPGGATSRSSGSAEQSRVTDALVLRQLNAVLSRAAELIVETYLTVI